MLIMNRGLDTPLQTRRRAELLLPSRYRITHVGDRVPGRDPSLRARYRPDARPHRTKTLVSMKSTVAKYRPPLPMSQLLALVLAGLVLGLALVVRWKDAPVPPAEAMGSRERAAQAVTQLEQEQEQLKARIAELREELAAAQRMASQDTDQLTSISSDLEAERLAAGLVALHGPGVVVHLDDSKSVPANVVGREAEDYLIHEYQLRDVANVLWAAGAEAVSINTERLVSTTSVYCVASTIMVNDTRLSPPYEIRAIGDRAQMQALLDSPNTLTDLRQRAKAFGLQFKINWVNQVDIPAYSGTYNLRHAHAGEVTP